MTSLSSIIGSLIDLVPDNTSRRFNCPVCSGENTFSITKLGSEVRYNCFRASCNGGVPVRGSKRVLASIDALKARFKGHTEEEREFSIPDYWVMGIASKKCHDRLLTTNSMVAYEKGLFKVAYDPSEDRLCYLVRNEEGEVVGAVGRALGYTIPKTINYGSNEVPFIVGEGDRLVLVEDCASACAVASNKDYSAMALLGTNLKDSYVPYIVKYDTIFVALDYDARKKAVDIKNKLRYYCKSVNNIVLTKDFKDMTKEEMERALVCHI